VDVSTHIQLPGASSLHAALTLPIAIRPAAEPDLAYCRSSWAEDYKLAGGNRKLPWSAYKRVVEPELRRVLSLPSTQILCADHGDAIVGWIAFARGARVSTVHWVRTRYSLSREPALQLRRRGIMTALLHAADLGDRIVYTHRGPLPRHRSEERRTSDEWISMWLSRRGVHAAFMSLMEWES
jgi:hypothetical protein